MYASVQDLIYQYGEQEARALSDRMRVNKIDHSILELALGDAASTIDTYLSRYTLPLKTVPKALKRIACDMARYYLCGGAVVETELIRRRYEDAIRFLEKVANGSIQLGLDDNNEAVETDDDSIMFSNPKNKIFSRDIP